ncbi:glycosyltransferase [Vibrio cholerae]|uniref:glycosyltransferase n=1 Tax=Vibrio cholerae TaxID=666 RepID=UPI003967548A|nr:glycosyltransferase [Vibrio cholerae]EGR2116163.1 glycosyltransferase [Vibrio cholerae]
MIDISVILPVYNAEKYLSESIASVLNQSYTNIELIIINDGSTDNSQIIIDEYKNDPRVRVVSRENKGLIYTLNEGISMSRGKYIARMDADDICIIDRFDKQISYMEENNLDICGGSYLEIDRFGKIVRLRVTPSNPTIINLALVSSVPFAHPSVIMRKSFIEDHNLHYGCENFKHAEDLALWHKFSSLNARFGNVNDVILKYRILSSSLSRVNKKNLIKDTRLINRKHYILCKKSEAKLPDSVNEKNDARILSEFIWHGFFYEFDISLINKLPLRRFTGEVIFAFLRQFKIFLGG